MQTGRVSTETSPYGEHEGSALRLAAFIAAASKGAPALGKKKQWYNYDGEHHISGAEASLPPGAILLATYTRIGSDIRTRMLLASVWPGMNGVVPCWRRWKAGRIAELTKSLPKNLARRMVDAIVDAVAHGQMGRAAIAISEYERANVVARIEAEEAAWIFDFAMSSP